MNAEVEYTRIDRLRSVRMMKEELKKLPEPLRNSVVLCGLKKSEFQFTRSYFAKLFQIEDRHDNQE